MDLRLTRLRPAVEGIYPRGAPFPSHARLLAPQAVPAFYALEDDLAALGGDRGGAVYSDLWRSAAGSLHAIQTKRGAQPPAFSGHNYGFSFDLDVDETARRLRLGYADLVDRIEQHPFRCYRRDRRTGMESWHFNYVPQEPGFVSRVVDSDPSTWQLGAEDVIRFYYGPQLTPSSEQVREMLARHNYRDIGAFKSAWAVAHDDRVGRVLAFIDANVLIDESGGV